MARGLYQSGLKRKRSRNVSRAQLARKKRLRSIVLKILMSLGLLVIAAFATYRIYNRWDRLFPAKPMDGIATKTSVVPGTEKQKPENEKAETSDEPSSSGTDGKAESSVGEEKQPDASVPAHEVSQKDEYDLHAVAYHFHALIYSEADSESRPAGYARRGAQIRVKKAVEGRGCSKGWNPVKGGGFICPSLGFKTGDGLQTFSPSPVQPDLSGPLPYKYEYVTRDDTLEYWKIPSPEKEEELARLLEKIDCYRKKQPPAYGSPEAESPAVPDSVRAGTVDSGMPVPDVVPRQAHEAMNEGENKPDASVEDEGPALPPSVHLRMAKGFYVSIDTAWDAGSGRFAKTVRGRFIRRDRLADAQLHSFNGTVLNSDMELPVGFVYRRGVHLLTRTEKGSLKKLKTIERLGIWNVIERIRYKKRWYLYLGDNGLIASPAARLARAHPAPEGLGENEKWIDVDLSQQTLVAYEGSVPVYATVVSTGRRGFETATGEFSIWSKHLSVTMDDPESGEDAYSIEDVPWTMYYSESFALHGAFWHHGFGWPRSHGCVNLAPADARWIFFWTRPHLPEGWHGISATALNPGTRIIIHE